MTLWVYITAFLTSLSANHADIEQEAPRAAAAVQAAYATFAKEPEPAKKPATKAPCPTGNCPKP